MPAHDPLREFDLNMTRRQLFGRSALGLGTAAMANLLSPKLMAADSRSALHHTPKAKRVIYLFMSGGPSRPVGLQAADAGDVRQKPAGSRARWSAHHGNDLAPENIARMSFAIQVHQT